MCDYLIIKSKIRPYLKYYLLTHKEIPKHLVNIIDQTPPITLENTLAMQFENFKIIGKTEQTQLSGKNLFDKNTMSTRFNRFMPNPTVWTISSADDAYSIAIPCLPNKTYTLSHKNTNATFFRIGYINVNPIPTTTDIAVYNGYRGENIFERTIQTGEDATFIIFQANMAEMLNTLETLQLEEGDTATDYEEYCGRNTKSKSIVSTAYSKC